MKANELKIGNYIQSKIGKLECKVLSIGRLEEEFEQIYCECEESFEWLFRDGYEGIPLTEEWLLKFGFKAYASHVNYKEVVIKLDKPSNHIVVRYGLQRTYFSLFNHSECDFTEMQFITEIKYVHQLQNLYFALTGEELKHDGTADSK